VSAEILLVNGPNLGRLGEREVHLYGPTKLAEIEAQVAACVEGAGYRLVAEQSNVEGHLIDLLEQHRQAAGAVVNPGALMMCGWALRDALADFPAPWIEVHITNVWAREAFRHSSVTGPLAAGVVMGLGAAGYGVAARALVDLLAAGRTVAT
jgi:5-deoxy-5-amino-3-dehydroquinate dehydratase